MSEIFNNPDLLDAIKAGKTKHEIDMIVGEIIRKNHPESFKIFPNSTRERIKQCLIATCSTEEEIERVLNDFGFNICAVSIMDEPKTEIEKEALYLCLAIGGSITKNGLPCMTMEW